MNRRLFLATLLALPATRKGFPAIPEPQKGVVCDTLYWNDTKRWESLHARYIAAYQNIDYTPYYPWPTAKNSMFWKVK